MKTTTPTNPRHKHKAKCAGWYVGHIELCDTEAQALAYVQCLARMGRRSSCRMAVLHEPDEGWKLEILS